MYKPRRSELFSVIGAVRWIYWAYQFYLDTLDNQPLRYCYARMEL